MKTKKYKFFIFRPGVVEVKQWRISRAFLWTLITMMVIMVSFALGLGAVQTWRVIDLSARLVKLHDLEDENLTQKIQIQSFAEKIETLETQMIRLHNLGMKLRLVSGVEGPGHSESSRDVGGPSVGKIELNKLLEDNINRQVRRMCDAVGHPVTRLVRTRIGPLFDRSLVPGDWRELTAAERRLTIEAVAESARQYDSPS